VNGNEYSSWFEGFYSARSSGLILYGRALGLGHGEAEDVLQETFLALMRLPELPREPENYCVRSFRNRALNYKRSLWRRLTREVLAHGHQAVTIGLRRRRTKPNNLCSRTRFAVWRDCLWSSAR